MNKNFLQAASQSARQPVRYHSSYVMRIVVYEIQILALRDTYLINCWARDDAMPI